MITNRRTILVWFLAAVAVACIAGCLWLLRWGQSHGAARDETRDELQPALGSADEFTAEYPQAAAFVEQWDAAVDEAVASGAILEADADNLKAAAAQSPIPD